MSKFVIYHEARTGSVMLQSALKSHSDITCLGEIFHHIQFINEYKKFNSARDYLSHCFQESSSICNGFKIQSYQAKKSNIKSMGFDSSYELEDVRDVLVEDNYKIIRTLRKNRLEQFASIKVAFKTNEWHVRRGSNDRITKTKIKFNINEFIKWHNKVCESTDSELKSGKLNQLELLNVFYEDMCDDWEKESSRIMEFLEVKHQSIVPDTVKGRTGHLSDWIENYDEAISFYEKFTTKIPLI